MSLNHTWLDHEDTPDKLAELNQKLAKCLEQSVENDSDGSASFSLEQEIEKIIETRANLVESLLSSLQEQQRKAFARRELDINQSIFEVIKSKRDAVRNSLAQISKASKAIKEYRQS